MPRKTVNDRIAEIKRKTNETDISVRLCIDGTGTYKIDSGIGFFDHMLQSFARHGLFDLTVRVKGDLHVDDHHTVEDTGIVLGSAIRTALGDKKGIRRYASIALPMDEALVLCALDISGRGGLYYNVPFETEKIGTFDTELVEEFNGSRVSTVLSADAALQARIGCPSLLYTHFNELAH